MSSPLRVVPAVVLLALTLAASGCAEPASSDGGAGGSPGGGGGASGGSGGASGGSGGASGGSGGGAAGSGGVGGSGGAGGSAGSGGAAITGLAVEACLAEARAFCERSAACGTFRLSSDVEICVLQMACDSVGPETPPPQQDRVEACLALLGSATCLQLEQRGTAFDACWYAYQPGGEGEGCGSWRSCGAGLSCQVGSPGCASCVRAQGLPCAGDWECGTDRLCEGGNCGDLRSLGGACSGDGRCLADQWCDGTQSCVAARGVGAACDPAVPAQCAERMVCDAGVCAAAAVRFLGEPCTGPADRCAGALRCLGAPGAERCGLLDEGAPCSNTLSRECGDGLWCPHSSCTAVGARAPGESCEIAPEDATFPWQVERDPCPRGYFCTGTCTQVPIGGEACTTSVDFQDDCSVGSCPAQTGICPGGPEPACTDDTYCGAGGCVDGHCAGGGCPYRGPSWWRL